ncbi:MAG: selenide, water dikinase SelD [Marinifilaceae bacterium]|jgi:selenide,water dikinase|nr:selenide, water dikinase SelD [Marinifilaceae bacterium]
MEIHNLRVGYGMNITYKNIEESIAPNYFQNKKDFHKSKISAGTVYYDLGDGRAMVNIVKYFPMSSKEFSLFGKYAATAALNEVYSIGYTPTAATIIGGWPRNKYTQSECHSIIQAAKSVCDSCNVAISSGYYTEASELFFGLSVTGMIDIRVIKSQKDSLIGDDIYITKPVGIEMGVGAVMEDVLSMKEFKPIIDIITKPDQIGAILSQKEYVHGMTNLSCFGLLGHLVENGKYYNLCSEISYHNLPKIPKIDYCMDKGIIPNSTRENWSYYKNYTNCRGMKQSLVLSDPVSCGGLLLGIDRTASREFEELCKQYNTEAYKIGRIKEMKTSNIYVDVI